MLHISPFIIEKWGAKCLIEIKTLILSNKKLSHLTWVLNILTLDKQKLHSDAANCFVQCTSLIESSQLRSLKISLDRCLYPGFQHYDVSRSHWQNVTWLTRCRRKAKKVLKWTKRTKSQSACYTCIQGYITFLSKKPICWNVIQKSYA